MEMGHLAGFCEPRGAAFIQHPEWLSFGGCSVVVATKERFKFVMQLRLLDPCLISPDFRPESDIF